MPDPLDWPVRTLVVAPAIPYWMLAAKTTLVLSFTSNGPFELTPRREGERHKRNRTGGVWCGFALIVG